MAEKKLERDPNLGLLIVIGGPGGSGCSTISKLVAQRYNLSHYYAGGIFRQLAVEKGYTDFKKFLEDIEKGENENYDLEIDQKLIIVSQLPNVLIEAKAFAALATIKGIPCSIKIWLDADLDTRVRRILSREGILKYGDPLPIHLKNEYNRAKYDILTRQEILTRRLKLLYGIDYLHPEIYNDVIIDSSKQTIDETFNLICKYVDRMKEKNEKSVFSQENTKGMDDFEVDWRRWKCMVCGYLYEGVDVQLKCPKCGNTDPTKFEDVD